MTREAVEEALGPLLPEIGWCFNQAGRDYSAIDPAEKARHSPNTRACIIRDNVIHYVKERFAKYPGYVRVVEKGQSFTAIVDERIKLRFKKLNKRLRPAYIPTRTARQFFEQITLPGLEMPAINLVAGYQWDDVLSTVSGVFVVCPQGLEVNWSLEVSEVQTPAVQVLPAAETNPKRVRLKSIPEQLPGVEADV